MLKKSTYLSFIIVLSIFYTLNTACYAQADSRSPIIVTVPGQDGHGSTITARQLFGRIDFQAQTPRDDKTIDFAQKNCQALLHETMMQALDKAKTENRKIIIIASSQGAGTSVNWLAKHPEAHDHIEALITEGGMFSGNHAIIHKLSNGNDFNAKVVKHLPLARFLMPYAAKYARFKNYAVSGESPIINIHKLPTSLTILILHHTEDYTSSIKQAQAAFGGLQISGHTQVDFVPVRRSQGDDKACHVNIIYNTKNIADLNEITPKESHVLTENAYSRHIRNILLKRGISGLTSIDSDSHTHTTLLPDSSSYTDEQTCKNAYDSLIRYEKGVAMVPVISTTVASMGLVTAALYVAKHLASKQ